MGNRELNTEQIILEAAEAEFLEKGYGNTKMMAIAKRANVAHSMLHYYFRSKENLFQTIFQRKSQMILPLFEGALDQQLSFSETVRIVVETQFDFIMRNPRLPHFILMEIFTNKDNRDLLLEMWSEKASPVLNKFGEVLNEEIRKGAIRPVKLHDLLMNIVSINIITFIAFPILQEMADHNNEAIDLDLDEKRESNVQFILAALRP